MALPFRYRLSMVHSQEFPDSTIEYTKAYRKAEFSRRSGKTERSLKSHLSCSAVISGLTAIGNAPRTCEQ